MDHTPRRDRVNQQSRALAEAPRDLGEQKPFVTVVDQDATAEGQQARTQFYSDRYTPSATLRASRGSLFGATPTTPDGSEVIAASNARLDHARSLRSHQGKSTMMALGSRVAEDLAANHPKARETLIAVHAKGSPVITGEAVHLAASRVAQGVGRPDPERVAAAKNIVLDGRAEGLWSAVQPSEIAVAQADIDAAQKRSAALMDDAKRVMNARRQVVIPPAARTNDPQGDASRMREARRRMLGLSPPRSVNGIIHDQGP